MVVSLAAHCLRLPGTGAITHTGVVCLCQQCTRGLTWKVVRLLVWLRSFFGMFRAKVMLDLPTHPTGGIIIAIALWLRSSIGTLTTRAMPDMPTYPTHGILVAVVLVAIVSALPTWVEAADGFCECSELPRSRSTRGGEHIEIIRHFHVESRELVDVRLRYDPTTHNPQELRVYVWDPTDDRKKHTIGGWRRLTKATGDRIAYEAGIESVKNLRGPTIVILAIRSSSSPPGVVQNLIRTDTKPASRSTERSP